MKKLILFSALLITFASCKKDEPVVPAQKLKFVAQPDRVPAPPVFDTTNMTGSNS